MKRIACIALSLLLLLSAFPFAVSAAENTVWNAKDKAFQLKQGPDIVRITADSDENGTRAMAYYNSTAEYKTLADAYRTAFGNEGLLYAGALGKKAEDVEGDLEVGVQLAYSFDGVHWVNDWETDDPENEYYKYYLETDFDFDGDDYVEYKNLPSKGSELDDLFGEIELFNGRSGDMSPSYCDAEDDQIKQALTLRNNALLQGKGEFTGKAYQRDDANWGRGFMIDFNRHTLYAKARYRVYNDIETKGADGKWTKKQFVYYSDWGAVKTYNNKTASAEKQDCVPSLAALNTKAAPTLRILAHERYDITRDGVKMKATKFELAVRYPAATETALSKYFALNGDEREDIIGGEWYNPSINFEIRVGDGDWYLLEWNTYTEPYFVFNDDYYWIRDILEDLGYEPGDPVYLRAVLYGSSSVKTERDETVDRDKLVDSETVYIKTARSNAVELSLTGKYNIRYELNGGSFAYGTKQIYQFDEDTLLNVDLTTKDYTPERKHFTFGGWYTTENFAKGTEIKAFDTAEKASRTYYAKWTELPFHTVSYDLGVITDHVYNPNVERVYSDDGAVAINDVEYAGAAFSGWFDAKDGGKRVTALSYASMKNDVTLYARWQLPEKKITYAGAGTEYTNNAKNPAVYQINPDGANTVCLYAPEKTGFIFDGWYLTKDFSNGALPHNREKDCWEMNEGEDVTLYAKWIRGRWDIHYELALTEVWNGGNRENYTYGDAVKLAEPTRTGYTFNGWFADAAFKTKVTEIKATDVGEKTFYAKWTAIQYKITYDLRDPEAVKFMQNDNPAVRTVDDEIILKPLVPTSKLYKFLGWYDNVNFDGEPIEKIAKGTDKDITVYAKLFKYSWGDVDFDGEVTAGDARLALRQAVGLEELAADALAWGDVDEHSANHLISAADARVILRMAVGLDTPESMKLPALPAGF